MIVQCERQGDLSSTGRHEDVLCEIPTFLIVRPGYFHANYMVVRSFAGVDGDAKMNCPTGSGDSGQVGFDGSDRVWGEGKDFGHYPGYGEPYGVGTGSGDAREDVVDVVVCREFESGHSGRVRGLAAVEDAQVGDFLSGIESGEVFQGDWLSVIGGELNNGLYPGQFNGSGGDIVEERNFLTGTWQVASGGKLPVIGEDIAVEQDGRTFTDTIDQKYGGSGGGIEAGGLGGGWDQSQFDRCGGDLVFPEGQTINGGPGLKRGLFESELCFGGIDAQEVIEEPSRSFFPMLIGNAGPQVGKDHAAVVDEPANGRSFSIAKGKRLGENQHSVLGVTEQALFDL